MTKTYRRRIYLFIAGADIGCAAAMAVLGYWAVASGLVALAVMAAYIVTGSKATR